MFVASCGGAGRACSAAGTTTCTSIQSTTAEVCTHGIQTHRHTSNIRPRTPNIHEHTHTVVSNLSAHDDAVSCVSLQDKFLVSGSWDTSLKVCVFELVGVAVLLFIVVCLCVVM